MSVSSSYLKQTLLQLTLTKAMTEQSNNQQTWELEGHWTGDIPFYGIEAFLETQHLNPQRKGLLRLGLQALDLASRGDNERAIASALKIEPVSTVDFVLEEVRGYLGAQSLAQAACLAIEQNALWLHPRQAPFGSGMKQRFRSLSRHVRQGKSMREKEISLEAFLDVPKLASCNKFQVVRNMYEFGIIDRPQQLPVIVFSSSAPSHVRPLTPAQLESIEGRSRGLTNKEVGNERGNKSMETQKRLMHRATGRYDASSASEVIAKTILNGTLVLPHLSPAPHLSPLHIEAAYLPALGYNNQEMADALKIGKETFKERKKGLFRALEKASGVDKVDEEMAMRLMFQYGFFAGKDYEGPKG